MRKLITVTAVAGCLAAAQIVLPGAAHAAVPGLDRESSSVSGSADFQSVTATCDEGKVLVGAGYQVTGATGEVIVDDFVPTVGPTGSVMVGAYLADPPYMPTFNWTLTAFAICADPLPGIVRVSDTSVTNSVDKSPTVPCPTGKVPLSAGFQITGATGEVTINFMRTTSTNATVSAYEEDPLETDWFVTVYAICADPLPGLQQITSAGPGGTSLDSQSVSALCPAGQVLLGMGFLVSGTTGEGVVDDFVPGGGPVVAPTSMTVVAYEADPNYFPNWSLTSYRNCATA
jgi:hypothetical protein